MRWKDAKSNTYNTGLIDAWPSPSFVDCGAFIYIVRQSVGGINPSQKCEPSQLWDGQLKTFLDHQTVADNWVRNLSVWNMRRNIFWGKVHVLSNLHKPPATNGSTFPSQGDTHRYRFGPMKVKLCAAKWVSKECRKYIKHISDLNTPHG